MYKLLTEISNMNERWKESNSMPVHRTKITRSKLKWEIFQHIIYHNTVSGVMRTFLIVYYCNSDDCRKTSVPILWQLVACLSLLDIFEDGIQILTNRCLNDHSNTTLMNHYYTWLVKQLNDGEKSAYQYYAHRL